jgi:Flp pilus assembly protein TadG
MPEQPVVYTRPDFASRHPGPKQRGVAFLRDFARDEDGVLIIFAVYVFLMILMVAGIGVDLMRFERDRAKLQYTLDRAILAAADLDQTLDPTAVVNDYFDKSGLSDYLADVTVQEGLGYRVVTANASSVVQTQFMRLTGIDTLTAPASGTAEERIDGVEISLVLDVSGSMASNSRLTNLKIAAKDFVDQMSDNSEDGKLSISIIPYATQVSAPDNLFAQFNVDVEQSYSNCINFQSNDFATTAIDPAAQLQGAMHFDPWYYYDGRGYSPERLVQAPVCEADPSREILVMQKNRTTLKNFIDDLSADGNTSIDVGMKWGSALLDPSLGPAVTALIGDGTVSADFATRPNAYNDGDTLKVIVLMTDGQNTNQYYINNNYRSGNSNVWWNDEAGKYSIYVPENDAYYWPFTDDWQDHPYGQGTYESCSYSYWYGSNCETVSETGSAVNITYGELWAKTTLAWNAYYNYAGWMGSNSAYSAWYYSVFDYVTSSTKNTRTQSICNAAKNQGIIVFTIGFEAPSSGNAVLSDCASSPSHFFDVQGLEISEAFSSIASSISKLRLTQ